MKKLLLISSALILFDQVSKHLIRYFFTDAPLVIVPGVLGIYPFLNEYLGWLGWFGGVVYEPTPRALTLLLTVFSIGFLVVGYRYLRFLSQKNRPLLDAFFVLAIAGIGGAFLDEMIFGGSWDFIYVFGALIFDVKDIYIVLTIIFINLFCVLYIPQHYKLSKEQRRRLDFFAWVRREILPSKKIS